jgi:hypothetical protein
MRRLRWWRVPDHKLTTYIPEDAFLWAQDVTFTLRREGHRVSIADVVRLALALLRTEDPERLRALLLGDQA